MVHVALVEQEGHHVVVPLGRRQVERRPTVVVTLRHVQASQRVPLREGGGGEISGDAGNYIPMNAL